MESSGTRIGSEIAGFRIESVLGRGGMSVVYLAEQVRLGRKVALKVLTTMLVERDDQFRSRFLQESHVAASLDHPNIIPIYDAGEDGGCLYIAMRYVEGRDLSQILEHEGPLGLGRTLFILSQVASALDTAHAHGLIHRDVKPANVLLVGKTDRVYLTDFGVAKPTTSAGLTRTGFFIGTPDYCAPEQIEGREVDARTDVYALGAVFYSSLTGLAPYARDTEVAVLQAHLLEPPPRLREQLPELSTSLDRVLARAMAKAKEDRYPTCGDFLAAAEAAAHDRPVAVTISEGSAPPAGEEAAHAVDPLHTVVAPQGFEAAQAVAIHGNPTPATPLPLAAVPAAPAPDAAPVPPGTGPTPLGSRFSGRLVTIALIAAIVALGAILAIVLATRGGSGHAAGNGGATSTFHVRLSSAAEVPKSVVTTLSGTADINIDGPKVCWSFKLNGVDKPTAAHIHQGGATVSGPVVVPLGGSYKPSGCTASTAAVSSAIIKHPTGYYVNVHSQTYPDGVVRGQLPSAPLGSVSPGTAGTNLTALEQAAVNANRSVIARGMMPLSRCTDRMLKGGIEQLSCRNVWTDVSATVYRYPSLSALYTRYHHDFEGFRTIDGSRLTANSHHCIGPGATGEAAWRHPPYPVQTTHLDATMPASMARRGWEGRVFCGQSSSQPFQFEWTFDPGRLLGIASSLDHNDVWVWWHAIHHNFLLGSMSMTMGGPPTSGASRSTPNGSPPSSTSSGSMQKMSK